MDDLVTLPIDCDGHIPREVILEEYEHFIRCGFTHIDATARIALVYGVEHASIIRRLSRWKGK